MPMSSGNRATEGVVIYDGDGRRIDTSAGMPIPHRLSFDGLFTGAWETYYLRRHDEALRHSRENALAMFLDEHIQACLWERVRATTCLKWSLEVDDDRDKWQRAVRDGLTKLLLATPRLRQLQRWLLWNALWCGRSGVQVRWGKMPVDVEGLGDHRGLCVLKHKPIDGDKIGYRFDDTPVVAIHGAYLDDIPDAASLYTNESQAIQLIGTWRSRVVIHNVNCVDADFGEGDRADAIHGLGIRHWLYWSWWNKQEYISAVIKSLDRVGLGFVLIKYDQSNPQAKEQAELAAKNLSVDRSVMTVPVPADQMGRSGGVEVVNTPVAGAQMMLELQAACERREERFIVAQTGSSRSDTSGMGTHDTDFMQQTFANVVEEDAGELAETLTGTLEDPGLVSVIREWTYPWADFPVRFKFAVKPGDPERRLGAVTMAFNLGARVKEDEVRDIAGLSAPGPDDDILISPQFLQLQQQWAQMQQQQAGGGGAGGMPGGGQPGAGSAPGAPGQEDGMPAGGAGAQGGGGGGQNALALAFQQASNKPPRPPEDALAGVVGGWDEGQAAA